MPNVSILLAKTFLNNFKYCDNNGKRNYAWRILSFFHNRGLTSSLEQLAHQTNKNIQAILEQCRIDKLERVDEITQTIDSAIQRAWELRIQYGSHSSSGGGHRSNGVPTYGSSSSSPRRQGKFEKDLYSAIDRMKKVMTSTLHDKKTGAVDNLESFQHAISSLKSERQAIVTNRRRGISDAWAD